MKLSEKQQIFTRNVAQLIAYAEGLGIGLTFGEAYRSQSQQRLYYFGRYVHNHGESISLRPAPKRTRTLKSLHADRLAVDFNFFIDGELTYEFDKVKPLGDYWESLHPKNRWGGDFNGDDKANGFIDTPHFEMQH